MVFRSLMDWIEFLKERGELVSNSKEVDLKGEIAAISRRICATNQKAIIHKNIWGYPGWQIFTDGLTTRQRQAMALGVEERGMVQKIAELLSKNKPIKPKIVDIGPVKEVKLKGDEINLVRFPIPFTSSFDSPPYITAGISNVKDPETGWQNTGIRRNQLKGKDRITNLILPLMHEGVIYSKYIQAKRPMPIAIVIADPIYYLRSQMPAPDQVDEMDYWGLFTGEPLEVVRCEDSDILVPATSEIVIEGDIDPTERVFEGPFSEFPGFYSGCNFTPLVRIKTITMRKDPIYQYLYMGAPPTEGHRMGDLMYEIELYRQTKPNVPELTDVGILSTWSITAAASLNKRARIQRPGLPLKLGMAMKGTQAAMILKNLIVVDDDIDVHSVDEVLWAFSVKFQPAKDIKVISPTMGVVLDPSEPWLGYGAGYSSFAIYDCTEKPPPYDEGYKRGRALPPEEAMEKVLKNWENYGFK